MHSLVYGVPVVTHDDWQTQGPEWEAIVPGKSGSFFRAGDVEDLARAIEYWIARPGPDSAVREQCYALIDRFYNPAFQRRAIDRAVDGTPADDLFWMKSTPLAA
jgi:hypothetical protein